MIERDERAARAAGIVQAGGVQAALESGELPTRASLTLAEAVVIGLLKQKVRTFIGIFGHGSTDSVRPCGCTKPKAR